MELKIGKVWEKIYFIILFYNNKITSSDGKSEIQLEPLIFPYSFNPEQLYVS